MRTTTLALAVALITIASRAFAQSDCHPDTAPELCTIDQAYEFYRNVAFAKPSVDKAAEEVTNENRAVEVPDAFAGRIHNTYQDFLNLLGFAINKIDESDDGQALTIRFNPFREGLIAAGGNLTISKPKVADTLQNDLPETGRTDLVSGLEKQMGDLDNLSWSGSATLQTPRCGLERNSAKRCFGRQPESYRNLLSIALSRRFAAPADVDTSDVVLALVAVTTPQAQQGNLLDAPLVAGTTNIDVARAQLRELAARDVASVAANQAFFANDNFDNIATLVDNQPQATLSATYNAPGRYGGPEGTTYTLELQYGNDNLNAIRKKCNSRVSCLQDEIESRLRNGANTMKWVLSASYKRNNAWSVPDLGGGDPVAGFDGFTMHRTRAFNLKGQGGWKLRTDIGGEKMRLDFSLEGERLEVGNERTTNRWVAASTFTVPLGEQMSVPVTVSWANRSEFLPEEAEKLGVHIGVSYRIPTLPRFGSN